MLALTFQVGEDLWAIDIRHIKEVVPRVPLRPVVNSPPWLAGVFVYRGQVVPVVDLYRLCRVGECPLHLSCRIVLVTPPGEESHRLVGLLAAQVADLRELATGRDPVREVSPGPFDLGELVADRDGVIRLLDLSRFQPASMRFLETFSERSAQ